MTDYYHPHKAVVIAGARVGSAMLCNALDSHPQISCEREDPLDMQTSPYFRQGLTPLQTLDLVLSRVGYKWCMCKVSYRTLAKTLPLHQIIDLGVEKIIHLWRENTLRVVVSAALNTSARNGERAHPTHAWETPPVSRIELDPMKVIEQGRRYELAVRAIQAELWTCGLPFLHLTFEAFCDRDLQVEKRSRETLWSFMEVDDCHLHTETKPINPYPLAEIITNWPTVRAALVGTEFERWIE